MPSPVRPRPTLAGALVALATLSLLAGCGGGGSTKPVVTGPALPVGTPAANAPDSAAYRFMAAYTVGVEGEAATLLSADFLYRFSGQSDPDLVSFYGTSWGRTNEVNALHHLLHGFTNGQGQAVPGATAMVFQLVNAQVIDDITHSDSSAEYRIVAISSLNLSVDVPTAGGATTYNISAPFQLHMVRGDAAVLGAGQVASTSHWYLREIDDLTTGAPPVAPSGEGAGSPTPASTTSWGKLRAQYL